MAESLKNEVLLRIVSKQYTESLEPTEVAFERVLTLEDEVEILTEATTYMKGGTLYIIYEEPEDTGFSGARTMIKYRDDQVQLRRYSADDLIDTNFILQEGVQNISRYKLPMGMFDMLIYTNRLEADIQSPCEGSIFIDYNIQFGDVESRRNKLDMEFKKYDN